MRKTSTAAASLLTVLALLGCGPIAAQTGGIEAGRTVSAVAQTDRTMLAGDKDRLFFWSTGDSNPQIVQGQRVAQALDDLYNSNDVRDLPLPERGHTAIQHSYGAPSVASVRLNSPGAKVTIDTSSGEKFVVDAKIPEGMTPEGFSHWLKSTSLEIGIDTRLDHEGDAALYFAGALFSDGKQTILATLEPCECGAGDVVAWLSTPPRELLEVSNDNTPAVIGRRSTEYSGEWTVETGSRQTAVGYTISRYSEHPQFNGDSVYAVRGDRGGHVLYIRSQRECGEGALVLKIDKGSASKYSAECHRIDEVTLAYTIAGKDVGISLESMLKAGNYFSAGVAQRPNSNQREWYHFGLRGSSDALNTLERDASMLGDAVTQSLAERPLHDVIVKSITRSLAKLTPRSPTPAAAHAADDYVSRYANGLANQIGSGRHPACAQYANSIRRIGNMNAPEQMRHQQVEAMFNKGASTCL